ncbi:MAG: 50S ribosomal protein L6 [Bdellovibrionales bacterium]|nr:50S ribosomal protein L6 [Bdellovibrionales bacterium]
MSRIGKQLIKLEKGIQVKKEGSFCLVQAGAKSLKVPLPENLEMKVQGDAVQLSRLREDKKTKSLHGLTRVLLSNAVIGLSKGWSKSLELNGVGYKASVSGKKLELNLGYSHPIFYNIPSGIEIKVEKQTKVFVKGVDKALVGLTAHQIRSYRPVEPYLSKGVKYSDEQVRRKAGKSGSGDKK